MGFTRTGMILSGYFFAFIPVFFVLLRVWARRIRRAKFSWDDYFIFCGLALTTGVCVCQIIAATEGDLGQHRKMKQNGDPVMDHLSIVFERANFAQEVLNIAGLGCIKASVVHLYMRIFKTPATHAFQVIGKIMLVVVAVWTIAFFFGMVFQCIPVLAPVGVSEKCVNIDMLYNASSITDIIIDFFILALPIPMVLGLKVSLRQRFAILGIFLLGTLAAASSIARLVVFSSLYAAITKNPSDRAYYASAAYIVTAVEMDLGIIGACLPTLRPIFVSRDKDMLAIGRQTGYMSNRYRRSHYKGEAKTYDDLELPVLNPTDAEGYMFNVPEMTTPRGT